MSENPVVSSYDATDEEAHPSIPEMFRWATLSAPELWDRVARSGTITDAEGPFLESPMLLCGPSGCGKTSLACALLRQWERCHPGRQGVFMSASRLGVARINHPLGMGEAPEVALAVSADLLLIDGLGDECDHATNAVPRVIYARHDTGLPTWVTTSMTARAITERYGEGLTRRISESGRVARVVWEGFVGVPYSFSSRDCL